MMIEIDYRLSPPWSEGEATLDLAAADETALRYRAFPGDQILRIDGVEFSAEWGWVPLLDFASALVEAVARLESGAADAAIDFTENDARIMLRGDGAAIAVSCTFRDGVARIGRAELAAAARNHAARLLADLSGRFPRLRANSDLTRWYPREG
jgi:hypothetical protein